jgi:NurA-like 5'-3' nuclease
MLDLLYDNTLRKKDNINSKIDNYFEKVDFDSTLWTKNRIKEQKKGVTLAGGDGSINKKKFLRFIFYAVGAESLIYNQSGLKRVQSTEVDIIPHHRHVEDRLRNYMGIFELKNAVKTFKEHDIDQYLFDGSPLGNLIRPFPTEYELKNSLKEIIKKEYLPLLQKELANGKVEISSSKISEQVEDEMQGHKFEAMIYLENLENLIVIRKLLEQKRKIVGISKTSTRKDYFGHDIPDIAIFDWLDKGTGYSQPKPLNMSSEVKREFPILNDFFRNLEFTIFYARLEPFKNILKFELPYHAKEEDVINILEMIKGNSTLGYPYILKKAHDDVVITNKDLKVLSKIIGFLEKSGREML